MDGKTPSASLLARAQARPDRRRDHPQLELHLGRKPPLCHEPAAAGGRSGRPATAPDRRRPGRRPGQDDLLDPAVPLAAAARRAALRHEGRTAGSGHRPRAPQPRREPRLRPSRGRPQVAGLVPLPARVGPGRSPRTRPRACRAGSRSASAQSGVIASAKHFPGLGLAARDTDRSFVRITATRARARSGLKPFKTAIADRVPLIMLSNALYTAYDGGSSAGWSRAIGTKLLRNRLGFRGATITDSLDGAAHARHVGTAGLAARAAQAGDGPPPPDGLRARRVRLPARLRSRPRPRRRGTRAQPPRRRAPTASASISSWRSFRAA